MKYFNDTFKILIIIIISTLFIFSCNKKDKKKSKIEFYKIKRGNIEDVIKITGTIRPEIGAEIKVGSRISGKVEKLFVKVGDYIKKGQLIAIIEHKDLKLKIEQLESEKAYLLNEVQSIHNQYPLKIKAKEALIKSLQIKEKFLKKELKRNKALLEDEMISKQNFDNLEKGFFTLQKTIDSENQNLILLKKEFKDKMKGLNIKLTEINKKIEIAKINFNYAFIKAPISGTVSTVTTQEGETVAASLSSPVFVNLMDLTKLEVVAYVDETDIGKVKINQKVKFYIEAFPDKIFTGKIKKIYPKAEITQNVVTYKIEIKIDKLSSYLKPEMTAYTDIILSEKQNVLIAPLNCVKLINSQNYIFVKDGDKIKKKRVKIGIVNDGYAEIIKGAEEGEEIVSKGFENVHSI